MTTYAISTNTKRAHALQCFGPHIANRSVCGLQGSCSPSSNRFDGFQLSRSIECGLCRRILGQENVRHLKKRMEALRLLSEDRADGSRIKEAAS